MALGIETWRLQGDLKLVSRHGLACLGSRPEFGVATWPGHGRGPCNTPNYTLTVL